MRSATLPIILLTTLTIAPVQFSAAQKSACVSVSADCVAIGDLDISISVGAGLRTNPLANRSDIPLIVIPQVTYYGKRFFIESLDVGFTLHETDAHALNIVATPGYDRVFFHRDDLQNVFASGVVNAPFVPEGYSTHRRRTTYLAGPEWTFGVGQLAGQLSALYDVTGRHDGYEVRGAVAYPLLQTEHSITINGGFTWKSEETVAYYYGVERLYDPGASLSPFVKLSYMRPLTERWTFTAFAHYEYLDDAIAHSPLVSDHDVVTAFAGFNFKLL